MPATWCLWRAGWMWCSAGQKGLGANTGQNTQIFLLSCMHKVELSLSLEPSHLLSVLSQCALYFSFLAASKGQDAYYLGSAMYAVTHQKYPKHKSSRTKTTSLKQTQSQWWIKMSEFKKCMFFDPCIKREAKCYCRSWCKRFIELCWSFLCREVIFRVVIIWIVSAHHHPEWSQVLDFFQKWAQWVYLQNVSLTYLFSDFQICWCSMTLLGNPPKFNLVKIVQQWACYLKNNIV